MNTFSKKNNPGNKRSSGSFKQRLTEKDHSIKEGGDKGFKKEFSKYKKPSQDEFKRDDRNSNKKTYKGEGNKGTKKVFDKYKKPSQDEYKKDDKGGNEKVYKEGGDTRFKKEFNKYKKSSPGEYKKDDKNRDKKTYKEGEDTRFKKEFNTYKKPSQDEYKRDDKDGNVRAYKEEGNTRFKKEFNKYKKSSPGEYKKDDKKGDKKAYKEGEDARFKKEFNKYKKPSQDEYKRDDKNEDKKAFKEGGDTRFKKVFNKYKKSSPDEYKKDDKYSDKKAFLNKGYSKKKVLEYKKKQNIEGAVRLNKYIANSGICSRREADVHIQAGLVSVNGKIITELGYQVSPGEVVKYNGEIIRKEKNVYVLLNKPKDYITTMEDPGGRKTVMDLVQHACRERIYPVGRLDRNTTGLLLFTNDGELAKKLTHPKYGIKKIYHVETDAPVKRSDMEKMLKEVELEDFSVKADEVSYVGEAKNEVGIMLHSGQNRVVRRLFEHFGYKVVKLDRVYYAGLTKKNLPRGKFRLLTDKEIAMLKMIG